MINGYMSLDKNKKIVEKHHHLFLKHYFSHLSFIATSRSRFKYFLKRCFSLGDQCPGGVRQRNISS